LQALYFPQSQSNEGAFFGANIALELRAARWLSNGIIKAARVPQKDAIG
jgi:hypothetical protein